MYNKVKFTVKEYKTTSQIEAFRKAQNRDIILISYGKEHKAKNGLVEYDETVYLIEGEKATELYEIIKTHK